MYFLDNPSVKQMEEDNKTHQYCHPSWHIFMAICVDPLEVITDDLMLSHVFYHVTFNMLVSIILSFSETFIVLLLHRFLCMLTCHSGGTNSWCSFVPYQKNKNSWCSFVAHNLEVHFLIIEYCLDELSLYNFLHLS